MSEDRAEIPWPTLVRRPHAATSFHGTPYYDEALGVAQSAAHRIAVHETAIVLAEIAREGGWTFLSDEPIWYLHLETAEQRVYYGVCVMARPTDSRSITADDLLLVIGVVSTKDSRKETKDTGFQRMLNEVNRVPEFALLFPESDDARALIWFSLADDIYERHLVAPGGSVASTTVPGLELRVLPREQWTPGYKVDVYFHGELRPRLAGERARAEQEAARAEQETARAEQEAARAEQETARAARLAEKLRALGVDPDAV